MSMKVRLRSSWEDGLARGDKHFLGQFWQDRHWVLSVTQLFLQSRKKSVALLRKS